MKVGDHVFERRPSKHHLGRHGVVMHATIRWAGRPINDWHYHIPLARRSVLVAWSTGVISIHDRRELALVPRNVTRNDPFGETHESTNQQASGC